jgi:hypothetical protein
MRKPPARRASVKALLINNLQGQPIAILNFHRLIVGSTLSTEAHCGRQPCRSKREVRGLRVPQGLSLEDSEAMSAYLRGCCAAKGVST